jgi:hypothetical protein
MIDLNNKKIDIDVLVKQASADPNLLMQMIKSVSTEEKNATGRYNCFQALEKVAELHPELLSPFWDDWVILLSSEQVHSRYIGLHLIAALAISMNEKRFKDIINQYFKLLDDESIINAMHAAGLAGKIAKAKPVLMKRITEKLLSVDSTHFEKRRQDLISSYILKSFDQYFLESDDKEKIRLFALNHVDCGSPKARIEAKKLLKKWMKE